MAEDVVKSVGRVFEVLELFGRSREPLNATEVERHLDYPQSSTLALLKSLVKLGYLSFDRLDRTYFPTMRIAYLGEWLESSLYAKGQLPALVQDIRERTGETVALSCQNDLQMQFLQIVAGTRKLTVNIQAGETAPLFGSIIGLTALSVQSDGDIAKLASRIDRRDGSVGPSVLSAAMARIAGIRESGYGVTMETYVPGIGAVAWPLPNDRAMRPLILSVTGPSANIRVEVNDIVGHVGAAFSAYL